MASVDFHCKCHGAVEAKAILRHCDKERRLKDNHSNEDIDKQRIAFNTQSSVSYEDVCQKYDDYIAELDNNPKQNKKKNRVTMIILETPAPRDLPDGQFDEWYAKVIALENDIFGEETALDWYVHRDEVHEYLDERGQIVNSRVHGHSARIPVVDGILNCRSFSRRENITRLNNAIQEMTQRDYGIDFMIGGRKGGKSVEELKSRTMADSVQQVKQLNAKVNEYLSKLDEKTYDEGFRIFLQGKVLEDGQTALERLEAYEKEYKEHEASKLLVLEPDQPKRTRKSNIRPHRRSKSSRTDSVQGSNKPVGPVKAVEQRSETYRADLLESYNVNSMSDDDDYSL